MSSQDVDAEGYEEKCSICGTVLKIGQGRFRMADQVLCIDCYYKRYPRTISKEEQE